MIRQVIYAARSLARQPSFALASVAAFAIGIAGVTTVFSLVHHVFLTPVGFGEPARLVTLRQDIPDLSPLVPFSEQVFSDLQAAGDGFESLAAVDIQQFSMSSAEGPVRYTGARVTRDFFPMAEMRPALGRPLQAADYDGGRLDVAVISHRMWLSHFRGDPGIIGQVIMPDVTGSSVPAGLASSFTIVGVLPAELWVPWGEVDVFLPLEIDSQGPSRNSPYLFVVARLETSFSDAAARSLLDQSYRAQDFQDRWPTQGRRLNINSFEQLRGGRLQSALVWLWAASGLVMLVVCANLANLMQARAAGRRGEIALRLALGASRLRAIWRSLLEAALLALFGGGVGVALTLASLEGLRRLDVPGLPRPGTLQMSAAVLLFSMAAATLSLAIFAVFPIWLQGQVDPAVALASDSNRSSAGRRGARYGRMLIGAETAVALVLLVAATAAFGSVIRLSEIDTGFVAENTLIHELEIPVNRFPEPAQQNQLVAELLDCYRAIPSVRAAGAVHMLPLSLANAMTRYQVPGSDDALHTVNVRRMSGGYFEAMEIPLLAGRALTRQDIDEGRNVVVVNRRLAEKHWPAGNPIGEQLLLGDQLHEIVGVVGNVRQWQLTDLPAASLYRPGYPTGRVSFVIRSSLEPGNLIRSVRQATAEVSDRLVVHSFSSLQDSVARSMGVNRLTSTLFSVFAAMAALVAVVGVFGVTSYSMTGRRQEIGVRMAVGASRAQILRMLVLQGWLPALAGSLLGLAALVPLANLLASLFYEFSLVDLRLWAVAAAVLNIAALLALWIPARRAAGLDPQRVLRQL